MRPVYRLGPDNVPELQIAWPYGDSEVDAIRIYVNGVPWLIVPGIPVGLPAAVWQSTAWVQDLVDVKKLVNGEWVEIDERDWGLLNARRTQ